MAFQIENTLSYSRSLWIHFSASWTVLGWTSGAVAITLISTRELDSNLGGAIRCILPLIELLL